MISTLTNIAVPSQTVIGLAIGGLLVLLIISQLIDFEGSSLRFLSRYIRIFRTPFLILFAFIVFSKILNTLIS